MKKLAIGLLTVLAGIVAVSAAAVPLQLASAQQSNSVEAMQSNSFSADVSQSIEQSSGTISSNTASQGFCLQANQQNAAAGDDATNVGVNSIFASRGGAVNC